MLQKVDIFARDKLLFFYIFTDKMLTVIKKKKEENVLTCLTVQFNVSGYTVDHFSILKNSCMKKTK